MQHNRGQYQKPSPRLREFVEYMAESIVDAPEEVQVEELLAKRSIIYELRVAPDDTGRVIGRHGRVANAMRTLLKVAALSENRPVMLEIF